MKRQFLKRYMMGFIVAGTLAVLSGCGQEQETETENPVKTREEVTYDKESNSLETWKQELGSEETKTISSASIRGIETVKDGEAVLAVSYEPRTYKNSYDCWSLSIPYESWVSVDTEAMYEYFDHVEKLNLGAAEITEEEAGLSDSGTSVFVAYYSDQDGENAGQAEPDKGITYWIGNEADEDHYYVKTSSGNEIWTADKEAVDGLLEIEPYNMILKVANVVSIETLSSVDIEIQGKTYTIDLSDQENENYKLNNKKADKDEVNALYTELMSIFIEEEIKESNDVQETSSPMMSITFHRNIEGAPEIVESFYDYDENYASVNINGTEFFLTDKSAVNDLIASVKEAF